MSVSFLFLKWYHLESNQGHQDFQSCALPSELWYRHYLKNRPVEFSGLQK